VVPTGVSVSPIVVVVTWLEIVVSAEPFGVTVVISPSIVETVVPKGCSDVPASVVAVGVSLDDSPDVVSEGFVPKVVWGVDVGVSLDDSPDVVSEGFVATVVWGVDVGVSLDDSPDVVSEGFVPTVVWGVDVGFSLSIVELPLQSRGGYTDSAWLHTLKLGSKIVPSGQSK